MSKPPVAPGGGAPGGNPTPGGPGSGEPTAVVTIAYQGARGSYSLDAARRYFRRHGQRIDGRGFDSFAGMLSAVEEGECDFAMLPVENTTAGSINDAYDLLLARSVAVVGEEILRVDHCLITLEPVHVGQIRRVISHPQALAQCAEFLASLEGCRIEPWVDTAKAVERVREAEDPALAAIASAAAADLHGLHVLKRGIADQRENFTRFLVIGREPVDVPLDARCKTSLIFSTLHEEGALVHALNALADQGLNLTKLESRPRRNHPWEYVFYVDFEGNVASENAATALETLARRTSLLKVLGSYPLTPEGGPRRRRGSGNGGARSRTLSRTRRRG